MKKVPQQRKLPSKANFPLKARSRGTVAEMNRGKQKTLSGMFGGTRKLKPLVALEVLDVFRHIATTSGNQSQKFKIDKIKSLLVRATNPSKTKYVIRGLQGKLRI